MAKKNEQIENMIPCIKSNDIDEIKTSVKTIHETQSVILASQRRIELQILGDREAKIEGISDKVDRHDKAILAGQRVSWIAIGIAIFASLFWSVFLIIRDDYKLVPKDRINIERYTDDITATH